MLSFKVIASFTIAIACAQLIALDAADARRGVAAVAVRAPAADTYIRSKGQRASCP